MFHKEFLCCHEKCAGIICLTPAQEEKYRRTHEDFRCPMGHVQGFYGANAQEKKIALLEQKLEHHKWMVKWRDERVAYLEAELRSRSARIGALRRKMNHYRSVHARYNASEKGRERARRYREKSAPHDRTKADVG